ncbi:MAG TPA: glutamate--tRNA ligase [Firmicutes bacterium]|nr:glutamate--tRNA ligase [Bacillota bacterium]
MAHRIKEPESPPRVRFAPSPTGDLHIGSARTALFNYLFARRYGGSFVLRIEDTDQLRSTDESLADLIGGLSWLGIKWNEGPDEDVPTDLSRERGEFGPYLQSARRESHHDAANRLRETGFAYYCVCPPVETVGTSRCKCIERQKELENAPAESRSLKFRIPPGPPVVVHDLIRGEVVFRRDDLQDFIIQRADGWPTYNFVVVVDDAAMKITHVIRGDDHLPNTPKQILIYEALGYDIPEFAHIPLIHGSDGTRMSKRHGAVSVMAYKREGFLPDAFVNYLARLGWNDDTDREIYSLSELEQAFHLHQVSSSPATFDRDKLLWFNGKYIRSMAPEVLYRACLPFLNNHVDPYDINKSTREWLIGIMKLYQDRITVLSEIAEATEYFFVDPKSYSEEDLRKAKVTGDAFKALLELKKLFDGIEWTVEEIEKVVKSLVESYNVKLGDIVHPLRLVVTGRRATPGIFETLFCIGKEPVLRRIEHFLSSYRPPG